MSQCPACNDEMILRANVANLHITGDEKYFRLLSCPNCNKAVLEVSMTVNLDYGRNFLAYIIDLSEEEYIDILKLMEECKNSESENCDCHVHKILDSFEMENISRKVVLVDDYDVWV